jgi:CubicO group peptidase (beta-lactamase class C family)
MRSLPHSAIDALPQGGAMLTLLRRISLLALALLLASCSQLAPPGGATFAPSADPIGFDEAAFDDAIEAAFDGQVRGYSAVLVNADGVQATTSGGWAQAPGDGDVRMRTFVYSKIGSVSKMLSGIALLNLFDKHIWSDASVQEQLDTPVWELLPQKWQDTYGGSGYIFDGEPSLIPSQNFEGVTFRHLLQHRSGFRLDAPNLPALATGHQMHWMLSQDVNRDDVEVRSYNNFNFTLLLYLIPAIAYLDVDDMIHESFKDLDVVEYSKNMTLLYGLLYEQYMEEEIFPNTVIPIAPTCRPIADLPENAYAKWYDGVLDSSGGIFDATFCRSQGSWYLTALELAAFARTFAFTNSFIGPTTRASLFDPDASEDRLLYNRTLTYTGFDLDQEEFAFHGGTQEEYRTALIELPYGYYGVAMVNSANLPGGGILSSTDVATALITAFDAAVDESPPTVIASVTGQQGSDGWYIGDVSLSWSIVEPDSAISSSAGCDPRVITTDTSPAGVTFTCSATSLGGTGSASVTIQRDATPPTVGVVGVVDGASYPVADPPVVACSAADAAPGSGILVANPTPTITDLGGGAFSARCVAFDVARNSASATVEYRLVSLDLLADEVGASGLNAGQMYGLLVTLRQAQRQLDRDKVKQAVNAMWAFRNKVGSLMDEGELLPAEGQALLDDIDVLLAFYD